jgi:hypothetical protein
VKNLSAGGQELQPWLVNSSTTPAGVSTESPASAATACPQTSDNASATRLSRNDVPIGMAISESAGFAGWVFVCRPVWQMRRSTESHVAVRKTS